MAKTPKNELSVEDIIEKAVLRTRIAAERSAKDAFKATEKRLYAYPIIKLKIEDDKERLEEIATYGAPQKSKSIVRFSKTGSRLSPEEVQDALVRDMRAEIAGNEAEADAIEKAISVVTGDQYADVIQGKYFDGKSDEQIAAALHCDPTTVRRNKSRLVSRISVFLYGVAAIK